MILQMVQHQLQRGSTCLCKEWKYCVVNNTYEPQSTTVYKGDGTSFDLDLEANGIYWYEI